VENLPQFRASMMVSRPKDFHSLTGRSRAHQVHRPWCRTLPRRRARFSRQGRKDAHRFPEGPTSATILREGDNLYIYTPNQPRRGVNIGKHRALADQYLALASARRATNLKKNYQISLVGEEDLDGHKTAVIYLVPDSEEMRKANHKI